MEAGEALLGWGEREREREKIDFSSCTFMEGFSETIPMDNIGHW